MIAKVTLLCAVVAFAHAGAPIVSSLGLSGLGLASPIGLQSGLIGAHGIQTIGGLGLRSIGGLGLASPLGLRSGVIAAPGIQTLGGLGLRSGLIGAPGIQTIGGLGLRSIGGLGLASPLGLRSGVIAAPGIQTIGGLGLRSIGGLGLASPLGLRSGLIGAPGIQTIGGLGLASPLGLAGGLKVAAAAPVIAKAVVANVPQPYEFGHSSQGHDGAITTRQESSDAGNNKQGSYSIQNPDGTHRLVTYVADAAGFRAVVQTNEHGTAPQNPAAVQLLAQEPPYKVLPAAAPLVKTVGIAAAPTILKAGIAGIGDYGGLGLVHG